MKVQRESRGVYSTGLLRSRPADLVRARAQYVLYALYVLYVLGIVGLRGKCVLPLWNIGQ